MDYDDCSSSSCFSNEHLLTPSPSSAVSLSGAPAPSPKRKARRKFRETRHPVYQGVRERNDGKWLCEARQPNKKSRIWLGTDPTAEMAARAHDVAAIALRSKSAALNFKDSAGLLPRVASGNADEIRWVASEAVEMFRPVASPRKSLWSSVSAAAVDEQAVARAPPAVSVDEEALFNMPGLLREMAEGMMLTPPEMQGGFDWDGGECSHMDMSLWSN